MTHTSVHTVLGAQGSIGRAITHELIRQGLPVRAVDRAAQPSHLPPEVKHIVADFTDPTEVKRAVQGASVVYYAAQPDYTRWPELFPPLIDALIEGLTGSGAKLVMVDNLYMYGPHDAPTTENLPLAATDRKGRVRTDIAQRLLTAHAAGHFRVTFGRLTDYYGPFGVNSKFGALLFKAALAGQPASWIGHPDVPRSYSYLPDVARAFAVLGTRNEADGQAWHLPVAAPLTGQQFLELVYHEAGHPLEVQVADRDAMASLAEHNPLMREFYEIHYQAEVPYILDASRFQKAFGPFEVTPHEQAIRDTLAWFRALDTTPSS